MWYLSRASAVLSLVPNVAKQEVVVEVMNLSAKEVTLPAGGVSVVCSLQQCNTVGSSKSPPRSSCDDEEFLNLFYFGDM